MESNDKKSSKVIPHAVQEAINTLDLLEAIFAELDMQTLLLALSSLQDLKISRLRFSISASILSIMWYTVTCRII
jgi:hypothetical protein